MTSIPHPPLESAGGGGQDKILRDPQLGTLDIAGAMAVNNKYQLNMGNSGLIQGKMAK